MVDENSRYAEIYSERDYMRDEDIFKRAEKSGNVNNVDWSSFSRLMMHDLLTNSNIVEDGCIGNVSLKDVQNAMKHPHSGWRILLRASEQLMVVSPHYYRLNMLFSNMALFCWGLDLYDVRDSANMNTVRKVHASLSSKLETMNLKHEFSKIMKWLPYQDIYCGLVVENQNDFFLQKVDYRVCRLYQVQDGLYNFQINLTAIDPKEIGAYPDYVQDAYLSLSDANTVGNIWYLPPADKQICVKMNSQWTYPYPMLIGVIKDIMDLDTYKKLNLQSARTDNYKAIMVKVPIDESAIDKPLLTPETLGVFAEINRESMTDDIGLIHTLGSNGEAISFKDSSNSRNNVSDANNEIYNSSGLPKELFNSSPTATAINVSIENDSGFIYGVYRQLERWVNRFIKLRKYNKSNFKFSFYLLDTTTFNRDNVSKRYKEACTLGIPVVDKYMSTLDMTPSKIIGSYITHNEIYDFYNRFRPLASSYNGAADASGSDNAGRPTNADKGEPLSEEGEKTADNDRNDR